MRIQLLDDRGVGDVDAGTTRGERLVSAPLPNERCGPRIRREHSFNDAKHVVVYEPPERLNVGCDSQGPTAFANPFLQRCKPRIVTVVPLAVSEIEKRI